MKIKTLIATLFVVATITSTTIAAEQVKVGMSAEPYPPFSSIDASGKWVGWEVEIIGAVCGAAKLDCVITPVAWDGIIPALNAKQIDMIMGSMSITEERMKAIDFSNKYYNTPAVVVADKGLTITPDKAGLKGKILGVQASTTHATYAQAHFADVVAELKLYQTNDEIFQDLIAGRIDAMQADSIAMADFAASKSGAFSEIKGAVAHDDSILGKGIGAGLRKGDDVLREKINVAIAAIRADGTYAEITKKYFSTDIFGE